MPARPLDTHQLHQLPLKVNDNNVNIALEDLQQSGEAPGRRYRVTIEGASQELLMTEFAQLPPDGLTDEVLLAILIDRASQRATGPARGREASIVRTKLEEAMFWMHYARLI